MSSRVATGVSTHRAALIGGIAYLIMFVLAIFANFLAITRLVDPDDATMTAANIIESELLFRAGLASFIVIFVLDVLIAWALWIVLRSVNSDTALLAAWFRVVGAALLGASLVFLFLVLELVSDAGSLAAFDRGQLDAQVLLYLDGFTYLWLIGLVCFGVHLILLGHLIIGWDHAPKVLGYLLWVAGIAYIIDTLARALLTNYDDYEVIFLALVAVSSIVAELWLALWLVLSVSKRVSSRSEQVT